MKRFLILCCVAVAFAVGCTNDNGSSNNAIDVSGTWHSAVALQSCNPPNVCAQAGLTPGSTATATMILTQTGSSLQGTYTYDGAGVTGNISGNVNGNQVTLDGSASNFFGRITLHFTGPINGNTIDATVMHDISLIDGRSGTLTGTGQFQR